MQLQVTIRSDKSNVQGLEIGELVQLSWNGTIQFVKI
jgi:hypothetical protein